MSTPLLPLLRKEIRQLVPILILWFSVLLMGYISQLVTLRLDEQSFSKWCSEFCAPGLNGESMSIVVFMAVFYIITAYSLFPREHDESTIDFLNALPVSQATIFLAKCLAAWLSVSFVNTVAYLLEVGLLAFNSQSIDGKAYPEVTATMALRDYLFAYVILAHGVFLSRFRTPGLIVYALYFVGLLWWENSVGSAGVFNLFAFYSNEYVGEQLVLNWRAIVPHLIAATLIYLCAYWLWSRAESRPGQQSSERQRSRWLGIVASVLAFLLITGVMASRFVTDDVMGDRQTAGTDHYDFVYRSTSEPTVDALAARADEDYQSLAALLVTDVQPDIVADLTANKGHVGGLAVWKKIQMDISDGESELHYRRVLSHETTHVFQSVMSARNLSRNANATRFFSEGMAQLTSFRVVPDESVRRQNWIVAALAWKRHRIRFRDLSNFNDFQSRFDAELVYTLADTWVEALVETCGERILGDVLRSAGRDGMRAGLPGELYWRMVLQHVDCELESVNIAWSALMENRLPDAEDHYPEFGALTFARNASSSVTLVVDLRTPDAPSSAPSADSLNYYLRVQPEDVLLNDPGSVFRGQVQSKGETLQVVFRVPEATIPSDRVRYQLGFRPEPGARLFFDRWQSAAVASSP